MNIVTAGTVAFVALVMMVAIVATSESDIEEAISQQKTYCQMVALNKDSGGEHGWPDYNGNYDEVCR